MKRSELVGDRLALRTEVEWQQIGDVGMRCTLRQFRQNVAQISAEHGIDSYAGSAKNLARVTSRLYYTPAVDADRAGDDASVT